MLAQCTQVLLTNVCRPVPGRRYQSMPQPFSCPYYGTSPKLAIEHHTAIEDILFSSSTSRVRWCSLEDCFTSRVQNGFLFFSGESSWPKLLAATRGQSRHFAFPRRLHDDKLSDVTRRGAFSGFWWQSGEPQKGRTQHQEVPLTFPASRSCFLICVRSATSQHLD